MGEFNGKWVPQILTSRSFFIRNPTPNDEPIGVRPIEGDVVNYVEIQNDRLVAGVNPKQKSITFWDQFFVAHPEVLKHNSVAKSN